MRCSREISFWFLWNHGCQRPLVYDLLTLCSSLCHRHRTCTNVVNSQEALAFPKGRIQTLTNINDSNSLSPQKFQVHVQNEGNIKASAAALFDSTHHLQYQEKLNFTKSTHVEFKMFSTEMTQCFTQVCFCICKHWGRVCIFWPAWWDPSSHWMWKRENRSCHLEGFYWSLY